MKYLVKSTEIVSSAKEDMDGDLQLFIAEDVKQYAQANHCFERSGAWQDSYIGSSTWYNWVMLADDAVEKIKKTIKRYNKLDDITLEGGEAEEGEDDDE